MPLVAPNLDDRTFEDLVREARLRIARYNPGWTDFNDSDPGMTLVQLFAWLTELMIYRLNRVPDRNYIKFLQLLGQELLPAQPALAYLTFKPDPKAIINTIPAGTQVSAQPAEGGNPLIFETDTGLDVVRPDLTDVQVDGGNGFLVVSNLNDPATPPFAPLGWIPQANDALYLGFTPPKTTSPDRAFPQQILFRVFLDPKDRAGAPQSVNEVISAPPPPVNLVWEYMPGDNQSWRRLRTYRDETAAFTREGDLVIEGPAAILPTQQGKPIPPKAGADPDAGKRYWLRGRLDSGTYPPGNEPVISFLRTNTVSARNVSTVREEQIGTSNGSPKQSFNLRHIPVLVDDAFTLSVEDQQGNAVAWQRRDDLLASGPDDPHFVLNPATGEVRFGDGKHGAIPDANTDIVVNQYRYGGGTAGNVPANSITTPLTDLGNVTVTNERAAVGGADEQAVDDLRESAPQLLRARNRAVTAEDFKALAEQAGGVARATAIPLAHPDFPDADIPGVVTVVVVPDDEEPTPQPSEEEIRAVCQYLNPFRLVTTEVYVKGPRYLSVRVRARVAVKPHLAFGEIEQKIIDAIDRFLDPLGRDHANGLPKRTPSASLRSKANESFGQDFYPSRLYGVILDADPQGGGIVAVEQLQVEIDKRAVADLGQPVVVPRDGLVFGVEHEIKIEPALDR